MAKPKPAPAHAHFRVQTAYIPGAGDDGVVDDFDFIVTNSEVEA